MVALGLKVKDREARAHNLRVARLCVHIGRQMSMSAAELRVLARAGLMHDIGKLGIPEAVLGKHSALDEYEWSLMRTHPEMGLTLLDRAGQSSREVLAVLYHHERLDSRAVSALLGALDNNVSTFGAGPRRALAF